MQLLSDEEAVVWCRRRALVLGGALPSERVSFGSGSPLGFRTPVAGSAVDAVALSYVLLMSGVAEDREENFDGGLLWLQDWDIWSETSERIGLLFLQGLRRTNSSEASVAEAPAHLFSNGRLAEAQAALMVPMLFQWDAYIIPNDGTYFCFVSHHGHMDVVARDQAIHDAMATRFERGGYAVLSIPNR